MTGKTLLYIPSTQIVDFVSQNPIDWSNKDWACRGGPGDKAGVPPTPVVEEFLNLLLERRALFTQEEFMNHCWQQWRDWIVEKPREQKLGLKAKLYRNFYPAMIDALHVWAMLVESGMFDSCVLNSTEDAINGNDLIVTSGGQTYCFALIGPTSASRDNREYKRNHRNTNGRYDTESIELVMKIEYEKSPGNKRWYRRSDIMEAILKSKTSEAPMLVAAD